MSIKFPTFFSDTKRPARPPTAAELAVKVTEAEGALRDAQDRVAAARATFATERTEAAQQAHREAAQAASDLEVMVSIVRDEHAAAETRERAEERLRLVAKLEELENKLTREGVLAATRDQAEREADLIRQLAECRARRRDQRRQFKALEQERNVLLHRLERPVQKASLPSDPTVADEAISPYAVREAIERQDVPSGLVAAFLKELSPSGTSYWPDRYESRALS